MMQLVRHNGRPVRRRPSFMGQWGEIIGAAAGASSGGGGGGGGEGGASAGARTDTTTTVSPTFQQAFTPQFSPTMQMSSGGGSQSAVVTQLAPGGQAAKGGETIRTPTGATGMPGVAGPGYLPPPLPYTPGVGSPFDLPPGTDPASIVHAQQQQDWGGLIMKGAIGIGILWGLWMFSQRQRKGK